MFMIAYSRTSPPQGGLERLFSELVSPSSLQPVWKVEGIYLGFHPSVTPGDEPPLCLPLHLPQDPLRPAEGGRAPPRPRQAPHRHLGQCQVHSLLLGLADMQRLLIIMAPP